MIIIDNSAKEMDFCQKTSEFMDAQQLRIFEIDFEYTMFAYYYEDGIHIAICKIDDSPLNYDVWFELKKTKTIYPDIPLTEQDNVWMNEDCSILHAAINQYSKF